MYGPVYMDTWKCAPWFHSPTHTPTAPFLFFCIQDLKPGNIGVNENCDLKVCSAPLPAQEERLCIFYCAICNFNCAICIVNCAIWIFKCAICIFDCAILGDMDLQMCDMHLYCVNVICWARDRYALKCRKWRQGSGLGYHHITCSRLIWQLHQTPPGTGLCQAHNGGKRQYLS